MNLETKHFHSSLLPRQRISYLKLLQVFDPVLLSILEQELNAGNSIIEVNAIDENSRGIMVSMVDSFHKDYDVDGIENLIEDDPHYNSIYLTSKSGDILAAPYK